MTGEAGDAGGMGGRKAAAVAREGGGGDKLGPRGGERGEGRRRKG